LLPPEECRLDAACRDGHRERRMTIAFEPVPRVVASTLSGGPSCTRRVCRQNVSESAADWIEHPPNQPLRHVPNDLALHVRQVVESSERAEAQGGIWLALLTSPTRCRSV
jgi:hypothetical protein